MSSFPSLEEFSLDVQQFAIYKRTIQGCSEKTVNEYMLDLRTFFRYLLAKEQNIEIESEDFVKINVTPIDAKYLSQIKILNLQYFSSSHPRLKKFKASKPAGPQLLQSMANWLSPNDSGSENAMLSQSSQFLLLDKSNY